MSTARSEVYLLAGGNRIPAPIVRQGAGHVDLWRAGTGRLLVRAGDIASINLGAISLTEAERLDALLTVVNLSAEPMTITVAADVLLDADRGQGLTIETPPGPMPLPAGGEIEVPVGFGIDPVALRDWTLRPGAGADAGAVDALEIDGYVRVTAVDGAGAPLTDEPAPGVPFYTLPRRASALASRGLPAVGDEEADTLTIANAAPFTGTVELFVAPTVTDPAVAPGDADEPDVTGELDLRRVGVRYDEAPDVAGGFMLTFGLATYLPASVPQVTRFEVYIDVDGDGTPDHRVRDGTVNDSGRNDRMVTSYGLWSAELGAVNGDEFVTDTLHVADLHSHLRQLSVPIGALGMVEPAPFEFFVVHRGLNEDWLFTPSTDVAPDGADEVGGPRYRVDPSAPARVPESWTLAVTGDGALDVTMRRGPGDDDVTLLAFLPDNRFEDEDGQLQVLSPGDVRPDVWPAFLPMAVRVHER